MKKFSFIFPVLILAAAGIAILGCTSDPTPPIEDFNLVFKGGKYDYFFDAPKIVDGKTYDVILTIEKCDDDFIGSYLGGKISFTDADGEEFVLSGWSKPSTESVSVAKTYRWTFEAGKKNSDSQTPVNPATTPDGGKQFFHFEAQDNEWHNYPEGKNFRIKGSFEVKEKQAVSGWVSEGEVTLGNSESNPGKGTLSADDTAKIRGMPEGSKIVISVSGVTVGAKDSGSNEPGWGIGSIGGWVSEGTGINSIKINIPDDTVAGDNVSFDCEIEISAIISIFPEGDISLNIWNGGITKAELFKPQF